MFKYKACFVIVLETEMKTLLSATFLKNIRVLPRRSLMSFVPRHEKVNNVEIDKIQEFIDNSTAMMVLTGAGISTESGIPDYRSEEVGMYARSKHRPIQHQEFMKSRHVRQRYWARNFVGWPNFSSFQPNLSHSTLAKWEKTGGKISLLVTQNVDRLHHKAGSKNVVELHGTAYEVKCMNCDFRISRHDLQEILLKLNPCMFTSPDEIRPDGDVELDQETINSFKVPHCSHCNDEVKGILKPDIVYFGDNVPKNRVDYVYCQLEGSDSLLVIGSSLQVFSGYRFVLKANELGKSIAIINIGPTRGDKLAHVKVTGKCSEVLSKICI